MNASLNNLIRDSLAADRIGVPVAARWLSAEAVAVESLASRASEALDRIAEFLSDEVRCLFAVRTSRDITVQARFARGGSSLITISSNPTTRSGFQLLVFGQRGILNWDDDSAESESVSTTESVHLPAIELSLAQGYAVSLDPRMSAIDDVSTGSSTESVQHKTSLEFARPAITRLAPPYGVLLIAGEHTHQPGYANAFKADGRARLVAVTDEFDVDERRRALNERFAQRLGLPYISDLRDALRRADVQIVCACAEPERRARILVQAAEAGKHLYLDKPLAGTLADAREIVRATREHHVVSHMFSQIHWPPASRAKEIVESGQLGEIVSVHCDLCFAKGHAGSADLAKVRRESDNPAQFELPDAKRELTNIGVYGIVFLLWLLKRPIRRVFATTGNFFFAEHQHREMEDFGQVTVELPGPITASITAGRTGWQSHPSHGLNRIYLIGTEGSAVLDAHRPRLETWSASADWTPPARDPDDPLAMWMPQPDSPFRAAPKTCWQTTNSTDWVIDVRHFLDCLEFGLSPDVPADLAAQATAALAASYRSAAHGAPAWVDRI